MAIEVNCPGCTTVISLPDTSAGKKARCNQCNEVFEIPVIIEEEYVPDPQDTGIDIRRKPRTFLGTPEQVPVEPELVSLDWLLLKQGFGVGQDMGSVDVVDLGI